jgi:tetratricopeptide (TPR) repeat protein
MKFSILILLLFISCLGAIAAPNCEIYKADENCYESCKEAELAMTYGQGSVKFQQHLRNAISLCPDFAHAYFELSVPYAKRGLIVEWLPLINKAIELDPVRYMGWRGWYHWFFMRNYETAIADIDTLTSISNFDIGATGDGLYHLNFMKALCYKGMGNNNKAIELMELSIANDNYIGVYDYLHLGVLYIETGEVEKGLSILKKQIEYNDISEAYYYSAIALKNKGEHTESIKMLEIALKKYENGNSMHDPYIQLPDKIFKSDIINLMKSH